MTREGPAALTGALLARKGEATAKGFGPDRIQSLKFPTGRSRLAAAAPWMVSFAVLAGAAAVLLAGASGDAGRDRAANVEQVAARPEATTGDKSAGAGESSAADQTETPLRPPLPPALPVIDASPPVYRIQLYALKSATAAWRQWWWLTRAHSDILGPLRPTVVRAKPSNRGSALYRLQAGPLKSAAAARGVCRQLRRRQLGCLVVGPNG